MYWTALGIDSNDFLAGVFCSWLSYDENVLFDVTSLMWALQLCTFQWIKSYSELTAWDTRTARWRHKRNRPPNSDLDLVAFLKKSYFARISLIIERGDVGIIYVDPWPTLKAALKSYHFWLVIQETISRLCSIQIMQHPDVNICGSRRLCYSFQLIYKPVYCFVQINRCQIFWLITFHTLISRVEWTETVELCFNLNSSGKVGFATSPNFSQFAAKHGGQTHQD